jgi:holo-[acyl-carrier protein] synthase
VFVGIGVDVLDVARVRRALALNGAGLGLRVFTPAEVASCQRAADPALRYAECFAAKEAAWKAVGVSPPDTGAWAEAEVAAEPGGRSRVVLHGRLREAARSHGADALVLTLSHTRDHAFACVVATTRDA